MTAAEKKQFGEMIEMFKALQETQGHPCIQDENIHELNKGLALVIEGLKNIVEMTKDMKDAIYGDGKGQIGVLTKLSNVEQRVMDLTKAAWWIFTTVGVVLIGTILAGVIRIP